MTRGTGVGDDRAESRGWDVDSESRGRRSERCLESVSDDIDRWLSAAAVVRPAKMRAMTSETPVDTAAQARTSQSSESTSVDLRGGPRSASVGGLSMDRGSTASGASQRTVTLFVPPALPPRSKGPLSVQAGRLDSLAGRTPVVRPYVGLWSARGRGLGEPSPVATVMPQVQTQPDVTVKDNGSVTQRRKRRRRSVFGSRRRRAGKPVTQDVPPAINGDKPNEPGSVGAAAPLKNQLGGTRAALKSIENGHQQRGGASTVMMSGRGDPRSSADVQKVPSTPRQLDIFEFCEDDDGSLTPLSQAAPARPGSAASRQRQIPTVWVTGSRMR